MVLPHPTYLDAIRTEGSALATAADGNLDRPVGACPGWTVADLVRHVSDTADFWADVVERRLLDPDDHRPAPRPDDVDAVAWLRDRVNHLLQQLAAADLHHEVWTWSHQRDIAFVLRRMAHELAVHRWDAQHATHREEPLGTELAADGIDEFLYHQLPASTDDDAPLLGGSVHIHCSDTRGEWLLTEAANGAVTVAHEHAKGDVAVRGPASDLLLLLWRRRTSEGLDVFGDPGILDRLVARPHLR